ncbi:hypothetical protein BGZ83_008641 [Gryganskiella cystojenkinii]|nr:hypothetical protein BGZ83_008641 [Gryganskiella cystojenkinii]
MTKRPSEQGLELVRKSRRLQTRQQLTTHQQHHQQSQEPNQQEQQLTSHRPSPLNITELLQHIGSYLDHSSLPACLLVCRDWHQTLLSQTWQSVEFNLDQQDQVSNKFSSSHLPSFDTLKKYSILIRSLAIEYDRKFNFAGGQLLCPNLSTLRIDSNLVFPVLNERSIVALIKRHQSSLQELTFGPYPSSRFLDAVEGCKDLKRLTLKSLCPASLQEWMDHYSVWSRMVFISWNCFFTSASNDIAIEMKEMSALLDRAKETTIQELVLHSEQCTWSILQAHVVLILKSPDLKHLRWTAYNSTRRDQVVALLIQAIRTQDGEHPCGHRQFGQKLESLALVDVEFTTYDFRDLFETLTAALTHLDLTWTNFSADSWMVLKQNLPRYLISIRDLNIQGCKDVLGSIVQDILCSMPNLEKLVADYVADIDIERDNRPWVCRGLKSLTLAFFLNGNKEVTQPMIVSRLLQLKQLEELDLDRSGLFHHEQQMNLPFRDLKRGCLDLGLERVVNGGGDEGGNLAQLATLRNLKRLTGPGSYTVVWGEPEAQWVLKHWVQLESLEGFSLDDHAEALLQNHINVVSYSPGL